MTSLSVIIPAWNASRYLDAAIQSVRAELLRHPEISSEIIVVNDGSTDDTLAVATAHAPLVRVFTHEHSGVAAARNRGVAEAQHELLAFLDADDLWVTGRLSLQLAALGANPDALILGHVEEFVDPDVDPPWALRLQPKPGPQLGFLAGALLCHRTTFRAVGRFDPALKVGEMVAWFQLARVSQKREIMLPEVVLRRRLHGGNLSLVGQATKRDYVAMARTLLKQRASSKPQKFEP